MGQIIQRFDFEGRSGALALPLVLSDTFSPHTFTLQSSLYKGASFSSTKLGQGALSLFTIPTRTEVSCDATDSCFIMFINSGDAIYEVERERFQVHAGQGVIINRGVSFNRRSGPAGIDVTILNLSQAQLRRHLPIEAGSKLQGDIHFSPRFDMSSPLGGTLWRCVQYVQNELISLDSGLDVLDNHIENLEDFLIRTVLDTVGRDSSLAGEAIVRNVLPAYMKKIISHMHSHCHEQIQLKDLCRVGNVCERTVSTGLKRYLNVSPKQYLKQLRLRHIHEELRRATSHTTVTDVATRWGFTQLGWFAAEYRKHFGESPSETLRSAKFAPQFTRSEKALNSRIFPRD